VVKKKTEGDPMTEYEQNLLRTLKTVQKPQWISAFLPKFKLTRRLCEVGVRSGKNLFKLMRCNPELMVAVDIWKNDGDPAHNDIGLSQIELDKQYASILEASTKRPNLQVLRMYSHEAAEEFEDGFFDFVYIDADHTYEGAKLDIQAWYPKIRKNGILSGHDYCDYVSKTGAKFGVKQAVNEFVSAHKFQERFYVTPGRFAAWFVLKP